MRRITASRSAGMAIGQMSRHSGVNIETIRYYERIKVLAAPPRATNGRRVYSSNHLRRLCFVRRARELGFGIADIRALLALAEPGHVSCAEVREIATAHLTDVRAKLSDLAKLEKLLAKTVARCSGKPVPICPVLEILET